MAAPVTTLAYNRSFVPVPPPEVIFGRSPQMAMVRQRIERVASANVPVLIQGESGTGKDILARLLHQMSEWASGPYVKVNCPAIPGTLMESELFGYEKGGFTGAVTSKPGRVELAHRGTLFLDEISELDFALQSKLLQLLQDGQFCRIGSQEDKRVEARIVCATNRQLEREVDAGRFRQDLFYRINVVSIHVPPLRERAVDIPILAQYFLDLYRDKYNGKVKTLSPALLNQLQRYHWPGNVRELENLVRRYAILGTDDAITSEMTAAHRSEFYDPDIPLDGPISLKKITRQAVRELEHKIIFKVLQANHWNRKRAARALSISYRALLYKIRESGLPSTRGRAIVPPEPAPVKAAEMTDAD